MARVAGLRKGRRRRWEDGQGDQVRKEKREKRSRMRPKQWYGESLDSTSVHVHLFISTVHCLEREIDSIQCDYAAVIQTT